MRAHWVYALLSPALVIGVTAIHEWTHALAALAEGARILRIDVLPSHGRWGQTTYLLPPGMAAQAGFTIAIAPYVIWSLVAIAAGLASVPRREWRFAHGSATFVCGYALPVGEVVNAALSYQRGTANDFAAAFGAPTSASVILLASSCALAIAAGYPVHRRLYGDGAVDAPTYALLVGAGLLCVVASGRVL